MKKILTIIVLTAALLGVASCGSKDSGVYPFQEPTKYITVKLTNSDKWSLIDVESGEIVAKDAFTSDASAVHEGMLYVYDDSTARYNYYSVENQSKPVNAKPYCSATSFNGGYAIACLPGDELQVIDKNCNTVAKLPASINSASLFLNGRAIVRDDVERFGFIDTKGDTVIATRLGLANAFLFDEVALVSLNEVGDTTMDASSLAVIDKAGKTLFEFDAKKYQPLARYYVDGALGVLKNDSVVYLDKTGKEVKAPHEIPAKIKEVNYRNVTAAGDDKYLAVKGDRMGLIDKNNNTLIKFDYNFIYNITPDRYVVSKDSVMMLVDDNGKQVGKAQFVEFKPCNSIDEIAGRGYINTGKAAAVIMQLFSKDGVLMAHKGSTLMDVNQFVGPNPDGYVGASDVSKMLPPVLLTCHFDRPIATLKSVAATDTTAAGLTAAQFDYAAVVRGLTLQYPVRECAPGTEEDILEKISLNMGKWGFGMNDDGTFRSDNGNVVVMGHDKGVFQLNYYFDTSNVKPLPRVSRSY